jgi:hypothetical protein
MKNQIIGDNKMNKRNISKMILVFVILMMSVTLMSTPMGMPSAQLL